jgi:hypothetical protein
MAASRLFFTRAPIFFSRATVNAFSGKEIGDIARSSRIASSLKPSVACLDLNFCPFSDDSLMHPLYLCLIHVSAASALIVTW